MDLVFDSIEHEQALEEDRRGSGRLSGIKNMFRKQHE